MCFDCKDLPSPNDCDHVIWCDEDSVSSKSHKKRNKGLPFFEHI